MKRVIKHQKKMKNTMYIVFGVFALALFAITRSNPSYASDGLILDDALDIIAGGSIGEEIPEEQPEIDEELVEGEDNEESQDLEDKDLVGEDGEDEELGDKGGEGDENQGEKNQGEELDNTEDNAEGDKDNNGEENNQEDNEKSQDLEDKDLVGEDGEDEELGDKWGKGNEGEELDDTEDNIENNTEGDKENNQEENLSGLALDLLPQNLQKSEELQLQDFTPTASKYQTIYITGADGTVIQTNNQEWEDLTLYYIKSDGTTDYYTLMDRNLGATAVYNKNWSNANTASFGYYYKWGNNYGFTDSDPDFEEASVGHWDEGEQGPCPTNYHVPTYTELYGIYSSDFSINGYDNAINFASDLLLPSAGIYSYQMLYKKMRAFYRSSTESDDTTAVALRLWPSDHNRIDVRYFGKSGGYSVRCFKDDENDILIDSKGGTGAIISFTGTVGSGVFITLGTPTRWTDTFLGRYDSVEGGNKIETGDIVVSHLYARWECPNDYIDAGEKCIPIDTTQREEGKDFNELIISTGGKVLFTIMDRNLGAMEPGTGEESYGNYYQWGNNYGFSNTGNIETNGVQVENIMLYGPGTENGYYSGSVFRVGNSNWATTNNPNLWGGEYSSNTDVDKQGPCPTNYHVPSSEEWQVARELWCSKMIGRGKYCDYSDGFTSDLLLPYAGDRLKGGGSTNLQGSRGYYWSSSPYDENYAYYIYFAPGYINDNGYSDRATGFSVRCFKNTTGKILSYELNGGDNNPNNPNSVARRWEQGTTLLSGVQEGNLFEGWYTTSGFDEGTQVTTNAIVDDTENDIITLYAKWACKEGYKLNSDGTACVGGVSVTYDANGGIFRNGSTQNIVSYEGTPQDTTFYSHTSNISDSGVQSGNYSHNQSGSQTVIITGAGTLHITLKCGTEQGWDYLYVFKGVYTGSVTKDMSAGQLYTCNGNQNSPVTTGLDIEGDTVTFSFYSDSSGNGYGYYAKIEGYFPYYINDEVEEPTNEGYNFLGWYEDENVPEFYDFTQPIYDNKVLYASWRINNGLENDTTATLLDGQNFNIKIKNMASMANGGNTITSYSTIDNLIKRIKRASRIPAQIEPELISTTESEKPVYARYNTGNSTLYYYSEAGIIYMNEDSSYMFEYLQSLISLDLNNFDTSKVTSMQSMFYECNKLESLELSNFDTHNVTDMRWMFYGCNTLEELDLSNFDTSKVTSMQSMFYNCYKLKKIELSNFNTHNVTDMRWMFYSCNALEELDVSNFDTSKVTNMRSMFYGCNTLEELDVSNFDTSNVIDMQNMFYNCYKLKKLELSNFDTHNVTDMGWMFYGCNTLEELDLSNFDTSKVTNMKSMFNGCNTLEELDVSNFDTSKVTSMQNMFYNCYKLKKLELSNFDTHNVTDMGWMFYSGNALEELDISNFDTSKVTNMKSMFCGCNTLEELDVSSFDTSKVTNMSYMFDGMRLLERLYASRYFQTTSVSESANMFRNDTKLVGGNNTHYNSSYRGKERAVIDKPGQPGYFTEKYVVNFDSKGGSLVKNQYVKYGDSAINPLQPNRDESTFLGWYMSGTDTRYDFSSSVIGEVFLYAKWNCVNEGHTDDGTKCEKNNSAIFARGEDFNKKIKSLVDSNLGVYNSETQIINIQRADSDEGVMEKVKVSAENSLNDIYAWFDSGTVYYYTTANVIYLNENSQYMFSYMNGIKSLDLSAFSIERIKSTNANNGGLNNIIYACNNLEELNISGWNFTDYNTQSLMMYLTNGGNAQNLKRINITNTVFSGSMNYAFGGMGKISEIIMDGIDTTNVTDMGAMFYNGAGLISLNIGDLDTNNVTSMGSMFNGCSSLTSLNLSGLITSSVENIGNLLGGCSSLNELNMDGWDWNGFSNTQNIGLYSQTLTKISARGWKLPNRFENWFGRAWSSLNIQEIDVSDWDLGNTISISGLFGANGSSNLIKIKGIDTRKNTEDLENISQMFYGCNNLESIDLTSLDISKVENMDSMFYGASNLKTVYVLDKFKTQNVTNSGDMFTGAISIVGGNGTTYDDNNVDGKYARIDTSTQSGYFTKAYSIHYNLGGGEIEGEKDYYTPLQEVYKLPVPQKENAKFIGWTGSNGDELQMEVIIQKGMTGDLEYTANWRENTYKIIFDTDGGNEINPIEIDYNSVIGNLPVPIKECNSFGGWENLSEIMPAHDITLKAIRNYTCSRSSGGGKKSNIDKSSEIHGSADTGTNIKDKVDGDNDENLMENNIQDKDFVSEEGVKDVVISNNSDYTPEQREAYTFAKSNGITTTKSIEKAKMNTSLKRIEMAKMLSYYAINVLGQTPNTEKGIVKFNDVTNKLDKQYDNGVTLAYQLGIMGINMKNNNFRPYDEVTRAEFVTALSRMLYHIEDGKGKMKYYEPHMVKLYNEGIITNTNPKLKEMRGYVMLMLMRSVK